MQYVNALGLVCPKPVIMAKKALRESDAITIDVDNEMSCENLQKMAKVMGLRCQVSRDGNIFRLEMEKTQTQGLSAEAPAVEPEKTPENPGSYVLPESYSVVVSSQYAGSGDDTLGNALMKSFIYTLTEADILPDCMIFYNGGVHLTCEGSPVLEDIQKLADAGVEVLSCGTCLNFYGLENQLRVGQVTNMYSIVEKQQKAVRIIRP